MQMKEKILNAAERRVRREGYSAMSFRDLANDVGIKSASVHYHFPTKPDLAEALVIRYSSAFSERLGSIPQENLKTALEGFVDLYKSAFQKDEAICLCAILSAEANTLPEAVMAPVNGFFDLNFKWLEALFKIHEIEHPTDTACLLVASLEGGMVMANASKDLGVLERAAAVAMKLVLKQQGA